MLAPVWSQAQDEGMKYLDESKAILEKSSYLKDQLVPRCSDVVASERWSIGRFLPNQRKIRVWAHRENPTPPTKSHQRFRKPQGRGLLRTTGNILPKKRWPSILPPKHPLSLHPRPANAHLPPNALQRGLDSALLRLTDKRAPRYNAQREEQTIAAGCTRSHTCGNAARAIDIAEAEGDGGEDIVDHAFAEGGGLYDIFWACDGDVGEGGHSGWRFDRVGG